MTYLRDFYEVLGECGMDRPPWPEWEAWATDNAELWPLRDGDRFIGGVFFKGHTVHIAVKPEYQRRWITKRILKAFRSWTHECEIVANPAVDNIAARKLAGGLGFKYHGTSPGRKFAIYIKEPVPCLQS